MKKYGQQTEGSIVHQDQDDVYLGHGLLYELAVQAKVRVAYPEDGAKGRVQMEALNSRFKTVDRILKCLRLDSQT